MKELTAETVVAMTGGRLVHGDRSTRVCGVTVDSRAVAQGDLFCAIRGEKADGHEFVTDAFSRGAAACLVSRPVDVPVDLLQGRAVILVPDTVVALGNMAREYFRSFKCKVVGVTGSVGKTSTKDMIYSVLSRRFRAGRNPGNLNSHIGLCLAIFQLEPDVEIAVLEMAMRAVGEISYLASIARPIYGVLTDVSESHIGVVGSLDDIFRGKAELIQALPEDGIAFLAGDNALVRKAASLARCRTVFYGTGPECDYRATEIRSLGESGSVFVLKHPRGEVEVRLPVPGRHQVRNAVAAGAVGLELGMTQEDVAAALEAVSLSGMRTTIIHAGPLTIIDDSYNASPVSCRAALDLLKELPGGRKVALMGDMLELGDWAPEAHRQVGKYAADKTDVLVCQGGLARFIVQGAAEVLSSVSSPPEVTWVPDASSAHRFLSGVLKPGDVVLVKASRAMKFEEHVEFLKAKGREMGCTA